MENMQKIYELFSFLCPIVMIVVIAVPTIFVISSKERRKKFAGALKKNPIWIVLIAILAAPIVNYAIGTLILFLIRGDCFVAHYSAYQTTLVYEDQTYQRLYDDADIEMAREYGKDAWSSECGYVTMNPVYFPYLEYWLVGPNSDEIYIPKDSSPEYIKAATLGGSIYFRRE